MEQPKADCASGLSAPKCRMPSTKNDHGTVNVVYTVDNSEILLSPVEVGSLSTIIYKILYILGG